MEVSSFSLPKLVGVYMLAKQPNFGRGEKNHSCAYRVAQLEEDTVPSV